MNDAQYHAIRAASSHLLKAMQISPAYCFATYIDPDRAESQSTDALKLGTLVHCLALTRELFETDYLVADYDRRSNAGKAHYESLVATGKIVIRPRELTLARNIDHALWSRRAVYDLLTFPKREVTFQKDRGAELLPLKARLDAFSPETGHIVELKTIRSLNMVNASIAKYSYLLSAAFYMDIAKAKRFTFIFVESCPPHNVVTMELSATQLAEGRWQYTSALAMVDSCWQLGYWPDSLPVDDDPLMIFETGRPLAKQRSPIDLEL